jgi:hypothetical protein
VDALGEAREPLKIGKMRHGCRPKFIPIRHACSFADARQRRYNTFSILGVVSPAGRRASGRLCTDWRL